jgi:hypothetical protein
MCNASSNIRPERCGVHIRSNAAAAESSMKLYLCVNEQSLQNYVDHLRVALASAIHIAKLEPHVLFDGDPRSLKNAVGRDDFVVHVCQSSIVENIRATAECPGWSRQAAEGALLRLEIPRIEQTDRFVLYADCDVVFSGKVELESFAPEWIAAAPGHVPCNWEDICSGVMLLNVENLRSEYAGYMRCASDNLGIPHFYDQETLNTHFKGRFDRLPLEYHWKHYWGANPHARIVHFHGPKRGQIDAFLNGTLDQGLREAYQTLFMQREGVDYYARLFDAIEAGAVKDPSTLAAHARGASRAFAFTRFLGWARRLRQSTPAPDFDEDFYLYANPDVAIARHNGWIPSGWWHFEAVGRKEGRLGAPPGED